MTTLREAVQEFVADFDCGGCGHFQYYAERFRSLLAQYDKDVQWLKERQEHWRKQKSLWERAMLAQQEQEQEPKAWMLTDDSGMRFVSVDRPHPDFVPLYTNQPRREWQGLTEDEIRMAYGKDLKYRDGDYERFARAVEAALKEKNQ